MNSDLTKKQRHCSFSAIGETCIFVLVLKMANSDFYVRYYVGHKGKFGHEFLEFEFRPDGKTRTFFSVDAVFLYSDHFTQLVMFGNLCI